MGVERADVRGGAIGLQEDHFNGLGQGVWTAAFCSCARFCYFLASSMRHPVSFEIKG